MDGTKKTLAARLALAAAAGLALAGAMTAGHAENAALAPLTAAAPVAAASASARFVPSAEASFAESFAPFDAEPAATVVPDYAVDITRIEPARPAAQDLGTGVASYYGRGFAGRPTASGERFDPAELTAAHRTLPFGSQVRVTNPRNGKSVVVRINDRGPFHGGRTIDLSRRAAETIGIVAAGHGSVELALLQG